MDNKATNTILRLLAVGLATIIWRYLFNFSWWQALFAAFLTVAVLSGLLAIWLDVDQLSRHFGQKD